MGRSSHGTDVISFAADALNQMLLNPRLSEEERIIFLELKSEIEKKSGDRGFILLASSGTSQNQSESAKLIALKVSAVLNSARRVNAYLDAQPTENWGLTLPTFHVAGLGVLARAFLAGSSVFEIDWKIDTIHTQLTQKNISYLSLVPAQVFDLIQAGVRAPENLKKVFVGAGSMNDEIREGILRLGWPVVETYGMTETSSMIAIREKTHDFKVMPGVEVRLQKEKLQIRCDSMLSAVAQKIAGHIQIEMLVENDWYQTRDHVVLTEISDLTYLQLLGRQSDYLKILGEGVSLTELRSLLQNLLHQQALSPTSAEICALPDLRNGFRLVLVFEKQIDILQSESVFKQFNFKVRPYEKLAEVVFIERMPRTELGKLKIEDLKRILESISSSQKGE
jgi:o-succinylbenzoate---CoA ligase